MKRAFLTLVAFLFVTSLSFGQIQNGTVNGWYVADTLNAWEASSRIVTSGGVPQDTNGDNYQVFRLKVYDSGKPSYVEFEKMIPKIETPKGLIWYFGQVTIIPNGTNTFGSYIFSIGNSDGFVSLSTAGIQGGGAPTIVETGGYFQGALPDSVDRIRLRIFPEYQLGTPIRLMEIGFDFLRGIKNDEFGTYFLIDSFEDTTIVGIEDEFNLPESFTLFQNYPNPFNPTTSIRYSIESIQYVNLIVYDMLGREVTTLVNEEKYPGTYSVMFDASGLSSGIYFYRLTVGQYTETKKMILQK